MEVMAMVSVGMAVWVAFGVAMIGVASRVLIPPLIWFGMAFVLHGSRSMPVIPGSIYLWVITYLGLFISERGVIPAAGGVYVGIIAAIASTTVLPLIMDRLVAPKSGALVATLTFPIAWVTVEFLRSRFMPGASWGSIAYTQYGWLTLMQVAAFAGIWGISFLIAWFASTLEWAWSQRI
jgi:apolipoprotein N-acyltransferase